MLLEDREQENERNNVLSDDLEMIIEDDSLFPPAEQPAATKATEKVAKQGKKPREDPKETSTPC